MTADAVPLTGLAALVPVGAVRFALATCATLVPAVAAATLAAWESVTGRPVAESKGRFAATLQTLLAAFDPSSATSVPEWIAHASLCLAAGFALASRALERQRRDDYVGRHRAWGWLAALLVISSFAAATPLGRVVSAALGDATGMRPGPGGMAWWVGVAGSALVATALWAVLPLRERATTVVWCTAVALAWGASATGGWLTAAGTVIWTHQELATRIAWWAGCSLALVSMIAATRALIRDGRGLVAARPARGDRRSRRAEKSPAADDGQGRATTRSARAVDRAVPESPASNQGQGRGDEAVDEPSITPLNEAMFVSDDEDDEADMRHLSKSERKRLRKLRKQRAAA